MQQKIIDTVFFDDDLNLAAIDRCGRPIDVRPTCRRNWKQDWALNPDKAEVAIEYPDKLYIGTFERSAQFDANLDKAGISLSLHRTGADNAYKSVHMHFHYAPFAEILHDLANKAASFPASDFAHRETVRDAAKALYLALESDEGGCGSKTDLTPDEEMRLLHILE
jgi:hypothetical protein